MPTASARFRNDAYAATFDEPSRRLDRWRRLDGDLRILQFRAHISAKVRRSKSTAILSSLLKVGVFPEDIAEAAHYFASDLPAKTTGKILDVDAENAVALAR